jgi:hypothetical protein
MLATPAGLTARRENSWLNGRKIRTMMSVKSSNLKPAFDCLAPVPRTRDTSIHTNVKVEIIDGLKNADTELPNLFMVKGRQGVGKSSLLNSIYYAVNHKFKGEYFPIALTFNVEEGELSKPELLRQIFDQVWESLLSQELVSLDTPEYKDWIHRLDEGVSLQLEQEFPLRASSIIAGATQDPNKESGITQALIATDWRSLLNTAKRRLPKLTNFVLFVDNLEEYKGQTLRRLLPMLVASPSNLVVSAYHEKNSPYFDEYLSGQDWRIHNYQIEEPIEPEFDLLVISELKRVGAPRKLWPSPRSFSDIYDTSGQNLVDFLIITNAIWEEIRSGRLKNFEINKTVLNRALKSIKSNSGRNTIEEIENLRHHKESKYEDIVDVLGSPNYSLLEICKVRNFPEILSDDKIEKEMTGLKKAYDLLLEREILVPLGKDGGHKGLKDSYVESYVRCLQREFRNSKRGHNPPNRSGFIASSLIELVVSIQLEIDSQGRHFYLHSYSGDTEDPYVTNLIEATRANSVLKIQEALADGQISISRDHGLSEPMHFYVLNLWIAFEGKSNGMTLGGLVRAPKEEQEMTKSISEYLDSRKDFTDYVGARDVRFHFALLNSQPTQDLADISLANSQVNTGMQTFHEHDYQVSFLIFKEGAKRLTSILERYGSTIDKKSSLYKKIKNEIADLELRASFVQTMLGEIEEAVKGFEEINRLDILEDETQWIMLDDLENVLAFAKDYNRALEVNLQAQLFRYHNLNDNYESEERSKYLLMYCPDRFIFDRERPEITDRCLFKGGSIDERKIPKLREIFYLYQLGKLTSEEATRNSLETLGDYRDIDSPAILRLVLWNLYRFGNNEARLKEMMPNLEAINFSASEEREDLYDDITTIKRLIR